MSICVCVDRVVIVVLSQADPYHSERAQLFRQHVIFQAAALHIVSIATFPLHCVT